MRKCSFILLFCCLWLGIAVKAQTPDANGIVYVKPVASGNGNGSSWANATANLQNAINATGAQKVFVAIGNFYVGSSSFVMKNNVAIYGGFDPGNGIVGLADARILPSITVGGTVLNGLNDRPVVYNDNNALTATAILDGFTMADGTSSNKAGGMYNRNVSPTVVNCVFSANKTTSIGTGGMYNDSASPMVINCIFSGNTGNAGGAMGNIHGASPTLINCLITGNSAFQGGSIWNYDGNASLINVTMVNNGSGFYAYDYGSSSWSNCIVWDDIEGGNYSAQYSLIKGASSTANHNINAIGLTASAIFLNEGSGDYRLKATSPVLNRGNNALYPGLSTSSKDLAGNLRAYNLATVDMGAYEYQGDPATLPVKFGNVLATIRSGHLQVSWTTYSEANNEKFIVQGTSNGEVWTDLGTVVSQAKDGKSDKLLTYNFDMASGGTLLAGFGLLGLFFIPVAKNRTRQLAVILLFGLVLVSCAKEKDLLQQTKPGKNTVQQYYIRISQVDMDGNMTNSQVVGVK